MKYYVLLLQFLQVLLNISGNEGGSRYPTYDEDKSIMDTDMKKQKSYLDVSLTSRIDWKGSDDSSQGRKDKDSEGLKKSRIEGISYEYDGKPIVIKVDSRYPIWRGAYADYLDSSDDSYKRRKSVSYPFHGFPPGMNGVDRNADYLDSSDESNKRQESVSYPFHGFPPGMNGMDRNDDQKTTEPGDELIESQDTMPIFRGNKVANKKDTMPIFRGNKAAKKKDEISTNWLDGELYNIESQDARQLSTPAKPITSDVSEEVDSEELELDVDDPVRTSMRVSRVFSNRRRRRKY